MAKVFIEESTLTNIGNAIRSKTGKTELIDPAVMHTEIASITSGGGGYEPTEEDLTIRFGEYAFADGTWDWIIEHFGDRIKTKALSNANHMFDESTVENIPFDLNFEPLTATNVQYLFYKCENLKSLPKINSCKPSHTLGICSYCYSLRNLPDDFESLFDWSYMDGSSGNARNAMFNSCYSLRSIPVGFLNHGKPTASYSQTYFYNGFSECNSLDELVDLPIPYTAAYTSNALSGMVNNCSRLKKLTFATNADGTPKKVSWKSQTLDLSSYTGYVYVLSYTDKRKNILNYNSGITADKEVTDDASYQALKNDPDWFTADVAYSRYNHDSAVETINSLPDASAYGTNTIKFKKAAGSATDGGAIENLTEEEIAVAAAKGWTVTLVS